jgi:hypothetical protein
MYVAEYVQEIPTDRLIVQISDIICRLVWYRYARIADCVPSWALIPPPFPSQLCAFPQNPPPSRWPGEVHNRQLTHRFWRCQKPNLLHPRPPVRREGLTFYTGHDTIVLAIFEKLPKYWLFSDWRQMSASDRTAHIALLKIFATFS